MQGTVKVDTEARGGTSQEERLKPVQEESSEQMVLL